MTTPGKTPRKTQAEISRERVAGAQARRAREGKSAGDNEWDKTGEAYDKKVKADAKKRDDAAKRQARGQHADGVKVGRQQAQTRRKTTTTAKRTAKRTVKRVPLQVRSARTGSVVGIFVASIALVGLYAFLQGAAQVPGFLHGVQRAVQWLASPTAVIPFKGAPK